MTVSATPDNMRRYAGINGQHVFAWSPVTREECSANPDDYFFMQDSTNPLLDSLGGEMVLVVRITQVVDVDMLEDL